MTSEQARFVEDPEAIITRRRRLGRGRRADPAHRRSFNLTLLGNRLTAGDPYQVRSDTRSDLPMGRVFTDAEEEALRTLRRLAEEPR